MLRKLSVNIDHIATIRNSRGTLYPDIITAGNICELSGADGITFHLREDRRHIKDKDVELLKKTMILPLHFEMAATEEMSIISRSIKPQMVTLVPEKRQELTTEGGLDIRSNIDNLREYIKPIKDSSIIVCLFVEPDKEQIDCAKDIGASCVELHTGAYSILVGKPAELEFIRLRESASYAKSLGLSVHAGHGIYYNNARELAVIAEIEQFSIGHGIISRALFVGLERAIREMKSLIS